MVEKGRLRWSILDLIEDKCTIVAELTLLVLMLITTADVILRYFFSAPIPGVFEITEEYLMPYMVFLGISYVWAKGRHVRVTLLSRRIPVHIYEGVAVGLNSLAFAYFVCLTVTGFERTLRAIRLGEASHGLVQYPLSPAYFVVVIGCGLVAARVLQAVLNGIIANIKK